MKVLMLGWEYPPKISGGLGIASQGLARGLTQSGVNVDFILPQTKGLTSTKRLQLLDANDYPTKGTEVTDVLEEITSEIRYLEVGTRLMPYLTRVEFEKIAYETTTVKKQVAEEVVLDKINLKGGYGPDLLQEIAKYALAVVNACKDAKYDVIHAHDWMTYQAGVMAKAATGAPLVLHVHSTEYDRSAYQIDPKILELEKKGLERADVVVTVSDKVKKTLTKKYGLKSAKVHVVHNAISATDVKSKRTPRSVKETPKVLFVGRLTEQKGPSRFLDMALELSRQFPDATFTIVGDGHLRNELEAKAEQFRIADKVKFTGFLSHQRTLKAMSTHDLLLLPSVAEPFSLVALEGALAGVPVIISREAGAAELVKSLKTIPYWDTHTWIKEAASMLDKPSKATQYMQRLHTEVKRLSWKLVGEQMKDIYSSLK